MDQNQTGLAAGNGKAGEAGNSDSSHPFNTKANGAAQGPEQTETSSKKVRGRSKRSVALTEAMYAAAEAAQPITGRGIGYKLFVKKLIASMARSEMQRVYRLLKEAREQGDLPWEWIVDETRGLEISATWSSPEEFAEEMATAYRRSFWDQQPVRCQVWSEKGTVRGLLKPVLNRYGVGFNPVHGFTSATDAYNVSQDDDGRDLIVLYVGDFDPSGMFMSEEDLPKRFAKYGGDHITLKRIALTGEHVLHLPSFPASEKHKDPRFKWFTGKYGDQCWELDAMDPNDLRECVEGAIKGLIEPVAWKRCETVNEAQRVNLKEFLDKWNSLEKFEEFRRDWLGEAS
jgi:hypothetical protein